MTLPLLKPTTIYVITISVYAGLSMFLESFMLWNGNSSPKNIGLTIVGYLYKRGIEKNDMGYACAVGMVLLVIALAINVVQLVATGTLRRRKSDMAKTAAQPKTMESNHKVASVIIHRAFRYPLCADRISASSRFLRFLPGRP